MIGCDKPVIFPHELLDKGGENRDITCKIVHVDYFALVQCIGESPQVCGKRIEVTIDPLNAPFGPRRKNVDAPNFQVVLFLGKDHQSAVVTEFSLSSTEVNHVSLCASDSL